MLTLCNLLLFQAEYKRAVTTNQWHRRLEFPNGETIVMHNPKVIDFGNCVSQDSLRGSEMET